MYSKVSTLSIYSGTMNEGTRPTPESAEFSDEDEASENIRELDICRRLRVAGWIRL